MIFLFKETCDDNKSVVLEIRQQKFEFLKKLIHGKCNVKGKTKFAFYNRRISCRWYDVAERLRHRSRVQRVPSSSPAWTSVLR